MLKRTKGRLLLAMLVVTGLAGTINDSSLSNQERKFAVTQLKDARTDLLSSIKSLSQKQLRFKPAPDKASIEDCLSHIIAQEATVWSQIETSMKQPANPEKRLELKMSDEDLLRATESGVGLVIKPAASASSKVPSDLLAAYKSAKAEQLKYIKTTTEDMRNHFVELPGGWVDCYQAAIFLNAQSSRYIRQIKQIVSAPGFPSN